MYDFRMKARKIEGKENFFPGRMGYIGKSAIKLNG